MSIHFISGKPGGGKSLYSVRLIVDELIKGNRPVVTNVPLKLGRLNEFLQTKYPSAFETGSFSIRGIGDGADPLQVVSRHVSDRVTLIDEDEMARFFTFRGNGVRLSSVNNSEWKSGKRPDYSAVKDSGVFYVLDEVHIAFNSRAWADTGHEVLYYLSQHRKLGDDVVCITQAISNVDKQFRSVAQDFTYIKNLGKQKMGMFRLPSVFTRSTYAQPATDTSKAMESGSFTLDVSGLASCYDTAKGVGIHGRAGADTNSRKKGLHWLWFAVGFPVALWALFHFVPRFGAHILSPSYPSKKPVSVESQSASSVSPSKPSHSLASDTDSPSQYSASQTNQPDLYCTGYMFLNGRPLAFLSDGTTWQFPSVQMIKEHSLVINGKEYLLRPGHAQSDYQPEPAPYSGGVVIPRRPINDAQVTVIGEPKDRSTGRLNGFQARPGLNPLQRPSGL